MAHQKKIGAKLKKPLDPFLELTWKDLEEWASKLIVARGRSYQRRGAVQDLERAENGRLVAWVEGTQRYATRVGIQGEKKLKSKCTCPYGTTCKHAVAVVLEYLEAIRTGVVVEEVEEDDPRLPRCPFSGFGCGILQAFRHRRRTASAVTDDQRAQWQSSRRVGH